MDTETTGLNGEVVEIGSVPVNNKGIIKGVPVEDLILPESDITFGAMGVHGITPEMVEGKPSLESVIDKHLPKKGYFIAHNATFDLNVLPSLVPDVKIICTLKLARKLFDKNEYGDHKNTTLWYGMGLYKKANYKGTPHRAAYDAQMTADILAFMLDKYSLTLDSAHTLINPPPVPVEESICWMNKHKDVLWVDVIKEDPDYCYWLLANYDWKDKHGELKEFINKKLASSKE